MQSTCTCSWGSDCERLKSIRASIFSSFDFLTFSISPVTAVPCGSGSSECCDDCEGGGSCDDCESGGSRDDGDTGGDCAGERVAALTDRSTLHM